MFRCSGRDYNGKLPGLLERRIGESKPSAHAMDARDNGSVATQCYGCHVVELYNEVRPHSSVGQLTPAEFKRKLSTTRPDMAIS